MIRGAKMGDRVERAGNYRVSSNGKVWNANEGRTGTVMNVVRDGGYVFVYVKPDHTDHVFVCGPRDLSRLRGAS